MHELGTMIRLVDLAVQTAREEGASSIRVMEVSVGKMTGILPQYLHRYFPQAAKGTAAQDAQLIVHEVPVRVRCSACGCEYIPDREHDRACPVCGSASAQILSGRDVTLDRIEI